jgi:glycosyltransferase involved in cell wall biosynthesis
VRVALVGPYPLDPSRVEGGVETAFTAFVSGLSTLPDVDAHVITFVPGLERPSRRQADGVTLHSVPGTTRLGSTTRHVREVRRLDRVLSELRPDVVHAQEVLRYGYVCLRNERHAPVVLNIHGVTREEARYAVGIDALRIRFLAVRLERYCVRNGRYFVQSTPYPAQVFGAETHGVFEDIRNPITERFFSIEREPEPGRLLYTGSVIPRKRLLDVVEALPRVLRSVPGARLRVAGPESVPDYAAVVKQRVRELGVESNVEFLGSVAPEGLVDEFRLASVFVLPSGQETSPLSIGEAMAAGVPVVAADAGGVRYLVEEGRTGHVVAVGDVGGLADRLSALLAQPDAAAALGGSAREVADREFRPKVAAARLRTFYERAIHESGES